MYIEQARRLVREYGVTAIPPHGCIVQIKALGKAREIIAFHDAIEKKKKPERKPSKSYNRSLFMSAWGRTHFQMMERVKKLGLSRADIVRYAKLRLRSAGETGSVTGTTKYYKYILREGDAPADSQKACLEELKAIGL